MTHPLKETPPWSEGQGWRELWRFWTPYERL